MWQWCTLFCSFCNTQGLTNKKDIAVSTANGKMILSVKDDGMVRVNMGEPIWEPAKIPFIANKFEKIIFCAQTFKPYFVALYQWVIRTALFRLTILLLLMLPNLGLYWKIANDFQERVNAGFMQVMNRQYIKLRVYERGAGETQACGSGACAAVAIGIMQGLLDNSVQVDLLGGSLMIEWKGVGSPLYMTGDATHIYDGVIRL